MQTPSENNQNLLREQTITLLETIAQSLSESAQDDRRRLRELANDLRSMFYIVAVIGEFNAGKSTFINALLEDDLLPMGITPTTEFIEVIRYAPTPERKPTLQDGGQIRVWGHPNTGSEGVAIVDTPGTSSIFAKHDLTAQDFLHRSDLVLFVMSAKRAFADTERLYLDLAKNYGKKIVLIINQIDLLEEAEQEEVRRFVQRQIKETLGIEPLLFAVSAKKERQGQDGNISTVRAHLRGVFASRSLLQQKLESQMVMAERTLEKHLQATQQSLDVVQQDTLRVKDIQTQLERNTQLLNVQLQEAHLEITKTLEALRERGHEFIRTNLSVGRMLRIPNREQVQNEFKDQVVGNALQVVGLTTSEYVKSVVDNSRAYWQGVIDRLNQIKELLDQELSGPDAASFAEQRANLEKAIRIAQTELETYSTGKAISEMRDSFEANMNGFTVSILATLGGLLALAGTLAVEGAASLLVGASILVVAVATPVAVIGGVAAVRYFNRVQRDTHAELDQRVDQLQLSFTTTLNNLTQTEQQRLKAYGVQILKPIFTKLELLTSKYRTQYLQLESFQKNLQQIQASLRSE
ncbi:MAG: dynamin family protein [Phototrophicaceae bacterium]